MKTTYMQIGKKVMKNKDLKIELEFRTKIFISDLINFLKTVTYDHIDVHVMDNLVTAALKFGSTYRHANRLKSRESFLAKLEEVMVHIYEADYLLKIVAETWNLVPREQRKLTDIKLECRELLGIFKVLKY